MYRKKKKNSPALRPDYAGGRTRVFAIKPWEFALSAVITTTFFACATIKPVVPQLENPVERRFVKNYTLGQEQTCYVGDPIVKIVDFYVHNVSVDKVTASNDFVVKGGPLLYPKSCRTKNG